MKKCKTWIIIDWLLVETSPNHETVMNTDEGGEVASVSTLQLWLLYKLFGFHINEGMSCPLWLYATNHCFLNAMINFKCYWMLSRNSLFYFDYFFSGNSLEPTPSPPIPPPHYSSSSLSRGDLVIVLTISFSLLLSLPLPHLLILPPLFSLSRGNPVIVAVSAFLLLWSFSDSYHSLHNPTSSILFIFVVVVIIYVIVIVFIYVIYVIVMITLAQRPRHPEKVHNPANFSSQSYPQISWQVNNETSLNKINNNET